VKVVFIGKVDKWNKYEKAFGENILKVSYPFWNHGGHVEEYTTFCKRGEKLIKSFTPVKNKESDLATIVYSSGTTGKTKGVVHTFKSLNFAGYMASQQGGFTPNDRMFSFLPLGHVVERALVQLAGTFSGVSISFADNLDTFASDLKHVRPTVFIAVPRIWSNIQTKILKKFSPGVVDKVLGVPVLGDLFKKFIKKSLGLDACRWIFTGGGALAPAVTAWYRSMGIEIREGYGLTENMGYAHFSLGNNVKAGYVGKSLPGVETVLGANSEILIKSDSNMKEYYLEPEATREAFQGEYLKTGDCGELDSEGQLRITGRLKEIFKTSKGKYISPAPIEQKILRSPWVENVCVVGSGFAAPVGLLQIATHMRADNEKLLTALRGLLVELNSGLESHEKLKHFVIVSEEWTIDNGFVTPTLKNKRNVIEKKYDPWLENHYGKVEDVCFEDTVH